MRAYKSLAQLQRKAVRDAKKTASEVEVPEGAVQVGTWILHEEGGNLIAVNLVDGRKTILG